MRKVWMAGALAAVALAAQGARADDAAAEERREAADATKAEMKKDAGEVGAEAKEKAKDATAEVKEETREAGAKADEKASEARSEMKEEGKEVRAANEQKSETHGAQAGRQEKKHPLFDGKDNFEVDGKIQKVSSNSITLAREELPAATLRISKDTKVELDGQQVAATQLKQGQDVKASFNLRNDKAEAVEIKAEKAEKSR